MSTQYHEMFFPELFYLGYEYDSVLGLALVSEKGQPEENLREPGPSLGSCTLAKRPTIASGLNLTAWYLSAPGNMLNKYITMSGNTGAGREGGGG